MISPQQFVDNNIGKAYAWDGPAYGVQCVGGFKKWLHDEGIPVIACPNDYAESYWTCKNKAGTVVSGVRAWQSEYFTKITDWHDFRDGDWVVWPINPNGSHPMSHVAMFFQGKEFGQRQYEDNRAFCLKDTNFTDALGALRWKGYEDLIPIPYGKSNIVINGHEYEVQRMYNADRITVAAKALNDVAKIEELDIPAWVSGKITNGNFFQMKQDQPDPYGTTYGDLSAPFNGVYQNLPNQETTLFYDLHTGDYGDCTDHNIDPTHPVFSPSLVYPNRLGHWEYARNTKLSAKDIKNWYTFLLKMPDAYAIGIAKEQLTPQQIANDFIQTDMIHIVFMDGGGSAQAAFWEDGKMKIVDPSGEHRSVTSAIAIYRPFEEEFPEYHETAPGEAESQENPAEEVQDEGEPMEEEKQQETADLRPQEGWTDPEPQTSIIVERIAALMSVKSILTLALTAVFGYLVINRAEIPDFFADIYKIVILFFFGYQTGKSEQKNGKQ